MKHFGHLKGIEMSKGNEGIITNLLLKDGLFFRSFEGRSTGFKDGILDITMNTEVIVVKPDVELVDEFYEYIMDIYKYEIAKEKLFFFKMFNETIFGLDFNQQKSIALKYFKQIYDDIYLDLITPFIEQRSDNGVVHNYSYSKLQMLSYQYSAFKYNTISRTNLNQYLQGNADFFEKESFSEKFDLSAEISFETKLQIVIELNDRFKFEEDLYFTQIRFDKKKFKEYGHIFKTLQAYQFSNIKIKSFTEDHKARIESLYEVLSLNELINDHKENFMMFLKNEYNLDISKIINYKDKVNFLHSERVALFLSEWTTLTSKK